MVQEQVMIWVVPHVPCNTETDSVCKCMIVDGYTQATDANVCCENITCNSETDSVVSDCNDGYTQATGANVCCENITDFVI